MRNLTSLAHVNAQLATAVSVAVPAPKCAWPSNWRTVTIGCLTCAARNTCLHCGK